jgi:hypothetical protein
VSGIGDIRNGLAANLATISGLRVSSWLPDNVNPPMAVIAPTTIKYDQTMGANAHGVDEYTFTVQLFVNRDNTRTAQSLLDSYCAALGSSSVKAALETDRTLSGAALDLRVTDCQGVTPTVFEDGQVYLTATWSVFIIANR